MMNTPQKTGELRLIFSQIRLIIIPREGRAYPCKGRAAELFYQQGQQDLHNTDEKAQRSPDNFDKTKLPGDDIV
jgi:hypothetical protein